MRITPIGKNVLVRMNDRVTASEGGIAIPERFAKPEAEGVIANVGAEVTQVTEGDVVGYPKHLGTRFEIGGKGWLILEERQLLYVRQ